MNGSIKRLFDIFCVITALPVFGPLILTIGVVVWLAMGRPILFRQIRSGYKGRPFGLLKFRTMNNERDTLGQLLPDSHRLTPVGIFLRKSSLDELPQLWNVLKGDMSLVGPRPLLMSYLDRYSPSQARRQEVKPGITGWAQIRGRNAQTWEEKFDKDIWYVDHMNVWLDARIILETIWNVLLRRGINQPGMATAQEFMGNNRLSS